MSKFQRYTVSEMHLLLCDRQLSERYVASCKPDGTWIAEQALVCPYYVPLDGPLAADWGVIVNPASSRFTLLTFEHDACGCPDAAEPGHDGTQSGVDWLRPKARRRFWERVMAGEEGE